MLYLDQQAIDVIRHATEAFVENLDSEMYVYCTPESGQVLEEFQRVLMDEIRGASDDQTTPAEDLISDLCWEVNQFDFFDNCDLTYLIYTSDIEEFYIRNSDEVDDAVGEYGGLSELAYGCDTISDMISSGVHFAQTERAMSASAYYADKADDLRKWLENELAEQYGNSWNDDDEDEN